LLSGKQLSWVNQPMIIEVSLYVSFVSAPFLIFI